MIKIFDCAQILTLLGDALSEGLRGSTCKCKFLGLDYLTTLGVSKT